MQEASALHRTTLGENLREREDVIVCQPEGLYLGQLLLRAGPRVLQRNATVETAQTNRSLEDSSQHGGRLQKNCTFSNTSLRSSRSMNLILLRNLKATYILFTAACEQACLRDRL